MSTSDLPPDISKIAGPLWGLFGALSVQVYIYYLALSKDPPTTKILVYTVYVAELIQVILYSRMAFKEFAVGFGIFEVLNEIGDLWFAVPILSSTVAFAVQVFYAYRIKLLAKSNFIAMIVVVFALVQLGGGIAGGVFACHWLSLFSNSTASESIIIAGIWNAGSAVCDIIIAVSMTYYLSRCKTGWKQTQRIVQRLITLIIGTGMLTATIAIVSFVLAVHPGHPIYFSASAGILGKMYSITMMVVLNNRIVIKIKDGSAMFQPSSSPVSNPGPASGGILVKHEQWIVPPDVY